MKIAAAFLFPTKLVRGRDISDFNDIRGGVSKKRCSDHFSLMNIFGRHSTEDGLVTDEQDKAL
jgi:hypothetical protein